MKPKEREAGYYRVLYEGKWYIDEWDVDHWLNNMTISMDDDDYEAIDEHRIETDPVKELERIEFIASEFWEVGYWCEGEPDYNEEWNEYKRKNGYV
jgi:hypothetical protein